MIPVVAYSLRGNQQYLAIQSKRGNPKNIEFIVGPDTIFPRSAASDRTHVPRD